MMSSNHLSLALENIAQLLLYIFRMWLVVWLCQTSPTATHLQASSQRRSHGRRPHLQLYNRMPQRTLYTNFRQQRHYTHKRKKTKSSQVPGERTSVVHWVKSEGMRHLYPKASHTIRTLSINYVRRQVTMKYHIRRQYAGPQKQFRLPTSKLSQMIYHMHKVMAPIVAALMRH